MRRAARLTRVSRLTEGDIVVSDLTRRGFLAALGADAAIASWPRVTASDLPGRGRDAPIVSLIKNVPAVVTGLGSVKPATAMRRHLLVEASAPAASHRAALDDPGDRGTHRRAADVARKTYGRSHR